MNLLPALRVLPVMTRHIICCLLLSLTYVLLACSAEKAPDMKPAQLPALQPGEAVATFAGGCFWSVEGGFERLKGVREVVSGYAGSQFPNPTYADVSTDQTDHAEAVQVYYDPNVISYNQLVLAFFALHDPTTLNRQGPDVGKHYRSMAFYRTEPEHQQVLAAIQHLTASKQYHNAVVTEVTPFEKFYPAEAYHQNFCEAHPWQLYIRTVSMPKIRRLEKAMPDQLKE